MDNGERTHALETDIFDPNLFPFVIRIISGIDGVYHGTLGKQEIIAEISADPDKPRALTGHYFYRSHGISISLKSVRAQDGSFLLAEYQGNKDTGGMHLWARRCLFICHASPPVRARIAWFLLHQQPQLTESCRTQIVQHPNDEPAPGARVSTYEDMFSGELA